MLSFRRARTAAKTESGSPSLANTSPNSQSTPTAGEMDMGGAVIALTEVAAARTSELVPRVDESLSIQDRIADRAYFRWVEAGKPAGRDVDYWLTAEQEILAEIAAAGRGHHSRA